VIGLRKSAAKTSPMTSGAIGASGTNVDARARMSAASAAPQTIDATTAALIQTSASDVADASLRTKLVIIPVAYVVVTSGMPMVAVATPWSPSAKPPIASSATRARRLATGVGDPNDPERDERHELDREATRDPRTPYRAFESLPTDLRHECTAAEIGNERDDRARDVGEIAMNDAAAGEDHVARHDPDEDLPKRVEAPRVHRTRAESERQHDRVSNSPPRSLIDVRRDRSVAHCSASCSSRLVRHSTGGEGNAERRVNRSRADTLGA